MTLVNLKLGVKVKKGIQDTNGMPHPSTLELTSDLQTNNKLQTINYRQFCFQSYYLSCHLSYPCYTVRSTQYFLRENASSNCIIHSHVIIFCVTLMIKSQWKFWRTVGQSIISLISGHHLSNTIIFQHWHLWITYTCTSKLSCLSMPLSVVF